MELYHNNMSVCAQKVRLVLREKNLYPTEHHLNLRKGEATRPEYLKLNPNGVIPTLIDQGVPIIESSVICEYLDEAYPNIPMRPKDLAQRAAMRVWTMCPDAGLHHACGVTSFSIAFRHQMLKLPPEEIERQLAEKPNPKLRENMRVTIRMGVDAPQFAESFKTYDAVIGKMSKQLDQTPWLAGNAYSLADAALLPYICRLEDLSLSWMWDARPSVGKWLERSKARTNYSGIADYLEDHYLQLMSTSGSELRDRLQAILAT